MLGIQWFTELTLTLTRWGRTQVIIDVYLSTTGGNPTSIWALEWPALFMMVWDFLHQGTKCLYSSTLATTSCISCIEKLRKNTLDGWGFKKKEEKTTQKWVICRTYWRITQVSYARSTPSFCWWNWWSFGCEEEQLSLCPSLEGKALWEFLSSKCRMTTSV